MINKPKVVHDENVDQYTVDSQANIISAVVSPSGLNVGSQYQFTKGLGGPSATPSLSLSVNTEICWLWGFRL